MSLITLLMACSLPLHHHGPKAGCSFVADLHHRVIHDPANEPLSTRKPHNAPEVTLTFDEPCKAIEGKLNEWMLTSGAVPPSWPAVPLRPIRIKVNTKQRQVNFVELILDGKPLAPKDYTELRRLEFRLPCPAPGRHLVQARYLKGETWSLPSQALRFEVRLPQRPRIMAISDANHEPAVVAPHSIASITSGEISIRLANVDRYERVVAYIDGKRVHSLAGRRHCCRNITVAGEVTPGVHTLTVRSMECCDSCGITSELSNKVRFHYYDEDIYVLRPATGCDNCRNPLTKALDLQAVGRSLSGTQGRNLDQMSTAPPEGVLPADLPQAPQFMPDTGIIFEDAIHSTPRVTFVGLNTENPAQDSTGMLAQVQVETAKIAAKARANKKRSYAKGNRSIKKLQAELKHTSRKAQLNKRKSALKTRIQKAQNSTDDIHVQRARDRADEASLWAGRADAIAEERIREARAHARTELANKVQAPSSPFFFASAAHFPLREFDVRGQSVDRDGLLIHEDMELRFDRDGDYEVHFRATAPAMPVTLRMQIQIQPHRHAPWYTVTLSPIDFPYPDSVAQNRRIAASNYRGEFGKEQYAEQHRDTEPCCDEVRECVCKGHSEILRRCYAELGGEARIRRVGTARFGFGVDVP